MALPSLSVIIPTYNRKESLERTLNSLTRQTYSTNCFEVIVVDDGSTDDTSLISQRQWPFRLHYYYQKNQGIARARNQAVSFSRAEYVAFLDDDISINPTYLESLLQPIASQKHGAITMATLVPPPDMPDTRFHRLYIAATREAKAVCARTRDAIPIPYYNCTGGVIAMCRQDYIDLGGMQVLPQGGKSTWGGLDFAYRAFKHNFDFYQIPAARAVHFDYAICDLETYSNRMYRVGRTAVLLLQRYPELERTVPLFHDRSFISPFREPLSITVRKLWRTCIGHPAAMSLLLWSIKKLEKGEKYPLMLRKLYIWYVSSSFTLGMRDGIREFGPWNRQGNLVTSKRLAE